MSEYLHSQEKDDSSEVLIERGEEFENILRNTHRLRNSL